MSKTKEFFTDVQTIIANSIPVSFDDAGQIAGNVLEYCQGSKYLFADLIDAFYLLDREVDEATIVEMTNKIIEVYAKSTLHPNIYAHIKSLDSGGLAKMRDALTSELKSGLLPNEFKYMVELSFICSFIKK